MRLRLAVTVSPLVVSIARLRFFLLVDAFFGGSYSPEGCGSQSRFCCRLLLWRLGT